MIVDGMAGSRYEWTRQDTDILCAKDAQRFGFAR
jgi:hypothetical protein